MKVSTKIIKKSFSENNIPETTGGAPSQGEISDDKITSLLKKPF